MLHLETPSPRRWLDLVENQVEELLLDHAHCEKKAAGTAMNLLFAYVDHEELAREMTRIVNEELEHFNLVLDLLKRRGIRWRRIRPSGYGARLSELIRKHEPQRAVDRLLVAGIIEARSCERFGLLREGLSDPELAELYGSLFESEARHYATYVRLAEGFAAAADVRARLSEIAAAEALIIAAGEPIARMHS